MSKSNIKENERLVVLTDIERMFILENVIAVLESTKVVGHTVPPSVLRVISSLIDKLE